MPGPTVSVCFVCLGNICRSPTAEGIFRKLVADARLDGHVRADSAGTGDWHVGERPDARSREAARRRGVALPGRARQFAADDFARFDLVIAMDAENHRALVALAPDAESRARVRRLREFDPASGGDLDVPDPYYGGDDGFDRVFDVCEAACRGLLAHLRDRHGLP